MNILRVGQLRQNRKPPMPTLEHLKSSLLTSFNTGKPVLNEVGSELSRYFTKFADLPKFPPFRAKDEPFATGAASFPGRRTENRAGQWYDFMTDRRKNGEIFKKATTVTVSNTGKKEEKRTEILTTRQSTTTDIAVKLMDSYPTAGEIGPINTISNKSQAPMEVHSITLQKYQMKGNAQEIHNIDGHYVRVNHKKIYTSLVFRSKTILLYIERSKHDDIKTCKIFTNWTNEDIPNSPNVIAIGEDGMTEMVKACRHLDDMGANRRKRFIDIIYPGTKWCGIGNIAEGPDDLGENVEVDKCCRTHDMCPDGIGPFESKYGLFNTALWYKSLCSCDEVFYNCLKAAGDQFIGTLFFNTISVGCIEQVYQEVCIRPGWWWTCREYGIDTSKPKIWVFQDNDLVY